MLNPSPTTIYLKDYAPPAFLISAIDLDVDLEEHFAHVRARLAVHRNPRATERTGPLVLDGNELELESVALDGRTLMPAEYELDAEHLTVAGVPERFTLETVVRIHPRKNTKLMGLYASKDGYFTQCEAEGFRRITFFIDRPDVMARYTTTIHADKAALSVPAVEWQSRCFRRRTRAHGGGAGAALGEMGGPVPQAVAICSPWWRPSSTGWRTASSRSRARKVQLSIFVEPGKLDQCGFAMQALKKSMKWDEEVFGLELDLDHYMIVAVGDFNMGAMENKGLNIFNTKYVLARPDIATDTDFMLIDRVVAHEYFHNWTGNRVTCRDWFQLSLKEGLTVFRDQEFGADMYSRPVQRIQEVRGAARGPVSGGRRPDGASGAAAVVHGDQQLLHRHRVREGRRSRAHDPHADRAARTSAAAWICTSSATTARPSPPTTSSQAMQDASGVDLTQFRRWYDQAGTPVVQASGSLRRSGTHAIR